MADDYARRLFEAMKDNNEKYGQLIGSRIKEMTGHSSFQDWQQCLAYNTTYVDCPIADHALDDGYTMSVIVHNPSSVNLTQARIAVPHGNYLVESFDQSLGKFVTAQASALCYNDTVNISGNDTVENCWLVVNHATPARSISLFRVSEDEKEDLRALDKELEHGDKIESTDLILKYQGTSNTTGTVSF